MSPLPLGGRLLCQPSHPPKSHKSPKRPARPASSPMLPPSRRKSPALLALPRLSASSRRVHLPPGPCTAGDCGVQLAGPGMLGRMCLPPTSSPRVSPSRGTRPHTQPGRRPCSLVSKARLHRAFLPHTRHARSGPCTCSSLCPKGFPPPPPASLLSPKATFSEGTFLTTLFKEPRPWSHKAHPASSFSTALTADLTSPSCPTLPYAAYFHISSSGGPPKNASSTRAKTWLSHSLSVAPTAVSGML